ncbi:MAG TPA: hypothetical protein VF471_00825 [Pseudoxanthomonas sp.]
MKNWRTNPAVLRCWRRIALAGGLLAIYPAFVLGAVYAQCLGSDLPGGRDGPGDAYRHTLASAIVAYTSSPRCVYWVTRVMERDTKQRPDRAMDAHNNRIGARIGASAESWSSMQQAVLAAIKNGTVDARSPDQITWRAPDAWRERLY